MIWSHTGLYTMPCCAWQIDLDFVELYTMPCCAWQIDLDFVELYTMPCANIALATFMKPATLAPLT